MKIPSGSRRKALAIIDVQKEFAPHQHAPVISNISKLLSAVDYAIYVEAVFSADRGSIWDLQTGWALPSDQKAKTIPEISKLLDMRRVIRIHKQTKSIFNGCPELASLLRSESIEELHLVGFDINDCVLASALDAFDCGFFTYVIEDCCGASVDSGLRSQSIDLLRYLHMTNNSVYELVPFVNI